MARVFLFLGFRVEGFVVREPRRCRGMRLLCPSHIASDLTTAWSMLRFPVSTVQSTSQGT